LLLNLRPKQVWRSPLDAYNSRHVQCICSTVKRNAP
jgi:hypothetical protein